MSLKIGMSPELLPKVFFPNPSHKISLWPPPISNFRRCCLKNAKMTFFFGITAILKIMGFLGKMAIRGTFSFFKAKGHY
jgi:hypothetical protein